MTNRTKKHMKIMFYSKTLFLFYLGRVYILTIL